MKRALIVGAIIVAGLAAGGWYLFKGQPPATPGKAAKVAPKQEQSLNPNEHGFFDVDFSQKMIVHHQQAIEMSDALLATSSNQQVRRLATDIRQNQLNDEDQYKKWLAEWGETYTDLSKFPQMDGHDMYPSYPGLVSAADMYKLKSATASDIDMLFVELMTKHHEGGIETGKMSNKLQYGKLIDFKNQVFDGYKNELEQLKAL